MFRYRCRFSQTYGRQDGAEKCPTYVSAMHNWLISASKPVVSLDIPFDSVRFYITQVVLDEMANEAGIRRAKGLYAPNFGARDLVMFGLAQALAGAMEQPGDGTAMFSDCIALAFFAHVVRAYGGVSIGGRNTSGGLAAWQLQRARDFINVNLAHDPSIARDRA